MTAFVMMLQFVEVAPASQTQADFDAAYRDWEVRSAVIRSKLRVYFPDTRLPEEWDRFARFVTEFYELAGLEEAKPTQTKRLLESIGSSRTLPASEQEALSRLPSLGVQEARVEWATLKAHALSWKDTLNQELLKAPSVLTERRLAR